MENSFTPDQLSLPEETRGIDPELSASMSGMETALGKTEMGLRSAIAKTAKEIDQRVDEAEEAISVKRLETFLGHV